MGMSGPNVIQFWRHWASKTAPNIVIFYPTPRFYLSDSPPSPVEPTTPRYPKPSPWWKSRLWMQLVERIEIPAPIQAWRAKRHLDRLAARAQQGWLFTSVPPDRLSQYARDVDSLVSSIRAFGAVVVLVTHATRFADPLSVADRDILTSWRLSTPRASEETIVAFERAAAAETIRIARRTQVPLVDLAVAMNGKHQFFVDAAHFTSEGAAMVARILRDSLLSWCRKGPTPAHADPSKCGARLAHGPTPRGGMLNIGAPVPVSGGADVMIRQAHDLPHP